MSQLPRLLAALTARLDPLARVGLDAGAWGERPGHLVVDDNDAPAERILAATGGTPADRTRVLPGAPGW
uniref:DUF5994 family protein n=1 Tax=Streptomyces asoensis TaxID=249586 RepID=UPI001C0EB42A|nr:DUF5994 family protein [Streptomyces asoensis]